uniref:Thioredoxin domain-containing protein n=1 Tax=Coccolithus braarudii TaxID=221442 RepID=A0A7S0LRI5_9EUKA|mmetsp:Transcript_6348/g.13850  ORF Transcript_6348/g.13850 Transcript_6348/m.13850 type:complete len:456 (+) Transcript_6348:116-1483(+)
MEWLKSVHFYRKVPRDLTEATLAGGTISLLSSIVMAYLFITNFSTYLQVDTTTAVRLDESQEKKILINFNVTLHHLPCRFASVDIADVMGTHLQNVSANIQKSRVGVSGQQLGRAANVPKPIEHAEAKAVDVANIPKMSPELSEENLKEFTSTRKLVMVNFYAPWCPWSRRLQPVWEEAYLNVMKGPHAAHVVMGKADCTGSGGELCKHQHIHAFPTIRVYRHHSSISHESYVGDRTHEALEKFVDDNVHDDDHTGAVQSGDSEVTVEGGEGCLVRGVVLVNRVPGNFHISAHSKSHSFQPGKLNMSHTVGHMTFGRSLSQSMMRLLPDDVAAAHNVLAGTSHVALDHNTTLEHYLKVVHTTYTFRSTKPLDTYQYTANSNNYEDGDSLPAAVFAYDMSPMQVFVVEETKSFASFLTQLCAIIGGVFTVTGLFDGLVYHGVSGVRRRMDVLGKSI